MCRRLTWTSPAAVYLSGCAGAPAQPPPRHPFECEAGPIRYTEGPYRFMNGTLPIPSLEAARPGIRIIAEVGVDKIREKSRRQTARLIELADQRSWRVNTPRDPDQRGGTVSIDMPDSQQVCAEL